MKLRYIYTALILSTSVQLSAIAQEQVDARTKGNKLYERYDYKQATAIFAQVVDTKRPKLNDLRKLADSYTKMNDYEAAENWYARVLADKKHTAEDIRNYAAVLKNNGKYAEAKKQLQTYESRSDKTVSVMHEIAGCDSALVWLAHPKSIKLRNEKGVNTATAQFSTFQIGDQIYFAHEMNAAQAQDLYGWTGNSFLKLFVAQQDDNNQLISAKEAEDTFNLGTYHIGPISSNKKGDELFITRNYSGKNVQKEKNRFGSMLTHNLELVILKKEGNSWRSIDFPYNNPALYSVGHAVLSPDEQTLYFASSQEGGFGGTDIWYTERQVDGSWSTPTNAGAAINTEADEMFPNFASDGTLYFSSNGWAGMGGLDIFKTRGEKSNWTKPQNLGSPINSAADDFSFLELASESSKVKSGFLSSNRPGGIGNDDIYSYQIEAPKILLLLEGVTYNKKTAEILSDVDVKLFADSNLIKGVKISNMDGFVAFELDAEQAYRVQARKDKFHGDEVFIDTYGYTKSDTIRVKLALEPIFKVNDVFVLEDIYYDFDKHFIRKDAAVILDRLVATLRDNPSLKIELSSHTDSRGSFKYNEDLSSRRAKAAVDYLVSRGISRSRLEAKGYGEYKLVNGCKDGVPCSIQQHQANRRTEVRVLAY